MSMMKYDLVSSIPTIFFSEFFRRTRENNSIWCSHSLIKIHLYFFFFNFSHNNLPLLNEKDSSVRTRKNFFPSISSKHKSFEEKRYWRGPVWVNCNWIIYQGLKNKDKKFAEIIRKKTINLVEKKKFREYYSCKSGLGMGAKNFSWTAALYLDFKLNRF